ncbi:MAG: group 1 truncated hemoglobin [Bacteroidetes bacterium]|nr:MAG: group 1 truncated hemoglobin [Bacteroidota bacterium]
MTTNGTQTSLFERIGGMTAVNAAVDIFYPKVLADASLSHFFTNVDMKTQAAKQKAFLAYAFGAPMKYSGQNMRDAHSRMQLEDSHFNSVAGHLVDTLKELEVPQSIIDEVVEVALSVKSDVLNK